MIKELNPYKKDLFIVLLGVFACLGLARFSFGMILPNMQHFLNMSATEAGIVGSSNFLGYFLGLFFVGNAYKNYGPRVLISLSLLSQSALMFIMSFSSHYLIAAIFFLFSGIFGAFANIALMTYIAQIVPAKIRGKATGIVVAGIGFAVIASGIVVPFVDSLFNEPWRINWSFFAFLILLISLLSFKNLKDNLVANSNSSTNEPALSLKEILSKVAFWQTGALFFIFGTCAIMFMTFFVAAVEESWGLKSNISGIFWTILGVSSILSGPIFGAISDHLGRYKTVAILFSLQALAHLIIALNPPLFTIFFSAFIFGISTWAIPSIMATLSSELFGAIHTARILAFLTLFFGVGQIIGPLFSGIFRDLTGSFSLSFYLSASLLASGVVLAKIASRG